MARRLALVVAVLLGAAALVLALAGETAHVDGRAVSCAGPMIRIQTGPDAGPFVTSFQRRASQACVGADRTAFLQAALLLALGVGLGTVGAQRHDPWVDDRRHLVPGIVR